MTDSTSDTPYPGDNPQVPGSLDADKSQYLQILSIASYVMAGFGFLFGCIPIIHLLIGGAMLFGGLGGFGQTSGEGLFAAVLGGFFTVIALIAIGCMWTYGVFMLKTGKALTTRNSYTLCLVMAGISCMFAPIGTVYGVLVILLLLDEEVKRAFGR